MKLKRIIIFLSVIIILVIALYFIRIKTAKVEVELKDNLEIEVYKEAKLSDYIKSINGNVPDKTLKFKSLGEKEVKFSYLNSDNIKVSYQFKVNVVDKTPPVIWLNESLSLKKNSTDDLVNSIMCGDNYDSSPNCYIEGEYDLNEEGSYSLVYKAVDKSNNKSEVPFTLNIYQKRSNNYQMEDVLYSDIVKEHKTAKTKIGLDISKWQEEVDFNALKENQVEFVMLRLGGTRGVDGEYFVDETFERNITEAKKYGLDVGVYFYAYSNSIKKAKEDALWVIDKIKDYDLELGVSYDFEDWGNFNHYKLSFYQLTEVATAFLDTIANNGYKASLYSSKNYLERIWLETKYDTWLAHYTTKTNYQGNYKMWQLTERGKIEGIDTYVDIDILYFD